MKVEFELVRRACWYRGDIPALFHCWIPVSEIVAPSLMVGGHGGGVVSGVLALLELEDGSMVRVAPEDIVFVDGGNFDRYDFFKKNIRRPAPEHGIGFDCEHRGGNNE